jgi:hypothetical protein
LVKISLSTLEIIDEIALYDENHPSMLEISPDGQTLYMGGGFAPIGVFEISVSSPSVPVTAFIDKNFYGLTVNPTTNEIYGFDPKDWTSPGAFSRYSLSGNLIDDYEVGIGPNGAAF